MGILDRIRDPNDPPGVAPPRDASRPGAGLWSFGFDDDWSAISRRNCSLFMTRELKLLGIEVKKGSCQKMEIRLGTDKVRLVYPPGHRSTGALKQAFRHGGNLGKSHLSFLFVLRISQINSTS